MSSGAGLKELRAGLAQACAHQIACEGDGAQLPGAKSACADALHSLLAFVASAPKDELSAAVRAEIDNSIFDDAATLKWHLLRGLQRTVLHRAYLGLPKSMEQTRRFLTKMPPKKMSEAHTQDPAHNVCCLAILRHPQLGGMEYSSMQPSW
jgi:hypothetical protein